jgi:hypothetical protein
VNNLKLIGGNEDESRNEIEIVKMINSGIKMGFVPEYVGNVATTMQTEIKEL